MRCSATSRDSLISIERWDCVSMFECVVEQEDAYGTHNWTNGLNRWLLGNVVV